MDHYLYFSVAKSMMHYSTEGNRGDSQEFVKCVIVGDTSVGKTRLICSYVYDEPGRSISSLCQRHHIPTVFAIDQYSSDSRIRGRSKVSINGVNAVLRIWDTFGDHSKNRKFAYQNANVVVLCYSIGMPSSLRNVNAKWYPEIKKYCPRAPIILVGTQFDRRYTDMNLFKTFKMRTLTDILQNEINVGMSKPKESDEFKCITPDIGRQTAREINAAVYLEASIVTKYGVNDVFENAIRAAFISRRLSKPLFSSHLKYVRKPIVQKPFLPNKPSIPVIEIPAVDIKYNFSSWYYDTSTCDITFMVQGELVHAHSIVLLTATPVFYTLLTHPVVLMNLGYSTTFPNPYSLKLTECLINGVKQNGVPIGFETIDTLADTEKLCKIFIKMGKISLKDFHHIIEMCYTGHCPQNADLKQLICAANLLQMSSFSNYLTEIQLGRCKTMNSVNPVELDRKFIIKQYLLKSNMYADIAFLVNQDILPAHKIIITAACPVMAGMFRNNCFKESITKNVSFIFF